MEFGKEYVLTLSCLKEIGIKGVGPKKILAIGNTIEEKEISINSLEDLASLMGKMKEKAINKVNLNDLQKAYKYATNLIEASKEQEIGLKCYYDEDFPKTLRKTVDEDGKLNPPLLLWYRGDFSITKLPGIAVIGTREPTNEGIVGGKYLAGEFAKRGFNIVSGLAIGCDSCGHEGALKVSGKTTAILANGLDNKSIYPPENRDLAEKIVKNGGLLISEYPINTTVNRYSLVARDRLQSGLAQATLVIQTGKIGGTMHAAKATLASNKPLYVMQFKNEETNRHEKCLGNAELHKEGAIFIKGSDNLDEICNNIKNREEVKFDLFD